MTPNEISVKNWSDIAAQMDGLRARVWEAMTEPGTTRQIAARIDVSAFSVRPRVTELLQMGLVKLVGREKREGVYVAVPLEQAREAFGRRMGAEQMHLAMEAR